MRGEISPRVAGAALLKMSPDADPKDHRAAVSMLIHARTVREQVLPGDWFADVAWDLMLALYLEHLDGMALSSAAIDSGARATSRRRWIDVIVGEGLAQRDGDVIALSAAGVATMRAYFAKMAVL